MNQYVHTNEECVHDVREFVAVGNVARDLPLDRQCEHLAC